MPSTTTASSSRKGTIKMPAWMDFIETAAGAPRLSVAASASRAHDHPRPWLRKKPTSLRSDMKSIISDFQKSARLRELAVCDSRDAHGRPQSNEPSVAGRARQPALEQSDHFLARDIVITDMQAQIDGLKRKVAAEQRQFQREAVEARDKLKDLGDRHVELDTQNDFLREAILDGQMGGAIDVERFKTLYAEFVKPEVEESEEEFSDVESGDYPNDAPTTATIERSLSRKESTGSTTVTRKGSHEPSSIQTFPRNAATLKEAGAQEAAAVDANAARVQQVPSTLQRTLSSTVHEYVEASYNASAPKKIRRSTSFQNVLRADEGMLSPLSRTGSRESVRSIDSGSRPGRGKSPLAKSRSKMSPALSRTSQSPPRSPLGSQEFSPKASSFAGSVAFGEDGMTRRSNADGSWTDSDSFDEENKLGPTMFDEEDVLISRYFARLMECQQASPGELPLHSITGSEVEFLKRQPILLEQISNMLSGSENSKKFVQIIDSADAKCRMDMVDVLAKQFKLVGMLMRVMYCVEDLSRVPLDPLVCFRRFMQEVKMLVGAHEVRLWIVDDKKSLIWEWTPDQDKPDKRPFALSSANRESAQLDARGAEGMAFGMARAFSAVTEKGSMPAVDKVDEELYGDSTILCEPILYNGAIVAIVQCFLDDQDGNTGLRSSFSASDHLLLRFMSELSGILFHRLQVFVDSMKSVETTMRLFVLTCYYSLSAMELYELSMMQLRHTQNILGASQCLLFLTSGNNLLEGRMWTKRADGLDTLMEVAFGDGIAGWVAETESPVVTHDVEKDNRFDFRIDTAYAAGAFEMTRKVSGILSIPMKKHDGTLFGVCSMIHMQGNTFTRGDQRLLEVHCELTVLSFKNEDMSSLTLDTPINLSVSMLDPLLGYVARTAVTVSVPNAHLDPRFNRDLENALGMVVNRLMCVPVRGGKDGSTVLGVLFIANRHPDTADTVFDDDDLAVAEVFCKQFGQLLSVCDRTDMQRNITRNQTALQDMERDEDVTKANMRMD